MNTADISSGLIKREIESNMASNGSNNALYHQAREAWSAMDYPIMAAFLGCVDPIFIPFGFLFNTLILVALSRRLSSLAETVQVYYLAIALFDLFYVTHHHLFLYFLDYGLGVLTNRTQWIGLVDTIREFCIYERVVSHTSITTTSWVYVSLAAERIYAVSYPLRARQVLTKKLALSLVVVFFVLSAALQGFVMYTFYEVPIGAGQTFCYLVSPDSLATAQATLLMMAGNCVPAPLTAVFAAVLLFKMYGAANSRNQLTSDKGETSVSLKELSGGVTVVIVSLIHVTTYTSQGYTFIASIIDSSNPWWNRLTLIFAVLSGATTCSNFIIYYFRVPGFKDRLKCQN